jgi:hypothetical protein
MDGSEPRRKRLLFELPAHSQKLLAQNALIALNIKNLKLYSIIYSMMIYTVLKSLKFQKSVLKMFEMSISYGLLSHLQAARLLSLALAPLQLLATASSPL